MNTHAFIIIFYPTVGCYRAATVLLERYGTVYGTHRYCILYRVKGGLFLDIKGIQCASGIYATAVLSNGYVIMNCYKCNKVCGYQDLKRLNSV